MKKIQFIEGTAIASLCDYSFGDQSSVICGVTGGYMKPANLTNQEFVNKVKSNEAKCLSLFIDNIRLYNRRIHVNNPSDQAWINKLMLESDLLQLCSNFPETKFVIFTNLEDTPIDMHIEGRIPPNVLAIHAVNAIYHNDKIKPFPYGVQRKLTYNDNKNDILYQAMITDVTPQKYLYVNHNVNTNVERQGINELFVDKRWATVQTIRIDYTQFLSNIKNHKFMICPIGNAVDCHRNWEVLYLKRVPVMKKNDYLEYLYKDFPVLFVNNYSDITEQLLTEHDYLFTAAQQLDLKKLDLKTVFFEKIGDINK